MKLDFDQYIKQSWNFWGMRFDISLPGPDDNIIEMQASINQRPGSEPWAFYENAMDIDSGKFYSANALADSEMENLSTDHLEQLLQQKKLHLSRRRFNHSWFVEYGGHSESFWFDIWIHRVESPDNLLEPQALQKIHLQYLANEMVDPTKNDEKDLFDDLNSDWQALNWRWQEVNSYYLQTYDEIKGLNVKSSYLFGQNFLLPLNSNYYIRLRFYRLNASNYREASEDFAKLVQLVIQNFKFYLPTGTTAALRKNAKTSLSPIDLSQQLSNASLETWKIFDKALRENTYEPLVILDTPKPDNKLANEKRFALIIGLVAIIIFICLGKGYFFIQDWLKANPDSPWNLLFNTYFLVLLLWCMRDRLKKWAGPSPRIR